MDILFVFAPLCNHEHPHLGLPMLKAYLKKNDFQDCSIIDFNVKIMDILVKENMANYKKYIKAKEIMKSNNSNDILKSGWASQYIAENIIQAGGEISKNNFDPISFHDILHEIERTNKENIGNNRVLQYIFNEVVEEILIRKPKILAFSITFASQIYYTLLICRTIKDIRPDIKIILGGVQISLFEKSFIDSGLYYFDALVTGEGEKPLLELADYWINGNNDIKSISNITYLKNNKYISNPKQPSHIVDRSILPDFNDYPLDLYVYPKLPYQTARGCYWGKCSFCGYRTDKNTYKRIPIDKIVEDVQYLKDEYGIRIFHFIDDAFHPRDLQELSRQLIDSHADITYSMFLRPEKEFINMDCSLFYKSGLRTVHFGVESGNNRILNIMNKGLEIETIKEVLLKFRQSDILPFLSLIIGFPTETEEEANETINFLLSNKNIYHKAYLTPYSLYNDMAQQADQFTIYDIDYYNPMRRDKNGYVLLEYSYKTKEGMTSEEILQVLHKGRESLGTGSPNQVFFK